jgi:hypothetical protein
MRSKWLDWPLPPKVTEIPLGNKATKPTKPSSVGFVGAVPPRFCKADTSCAEAKLPVSDPYALRMKAALNQINAPDYPVGMMAWLGCALPELYVELTVHLPDEIQRLWSDRASLIEFEFFLARLVSLHRQCCELFVASLRG